MQESIVSSHVRKRSCTNMGVKESQCKRIATYLNGVGILTPMDALDMFGCFLRNGGMKIVTKYVTQNGKTFAQYRLG